MRAPNAILCLALVFIQQWVTSANSATTRSQSSVIQTADAGGNRNRDVTASGMLDSMYRKSRQLRCVRCYEDRSYGYDERSRGGYSSRTADDRNWYYPGGYDTDRSSPSSYRDRDDRYSSRYYDRYEPRGYERFGERHGADRYGGDRYGADRYGADRYGADRYGGDRYGADRYGADRYSADRYGADRHGGDRYGGDRYGGDRYGADRHGGDRYGADRFGGDRYSDPYRDRYYDRSRQGGDRDYYDRYNQRYDYRNYKPFDETYRGQSGFDNAGRGYYFAGDDKQDSNSRRYLPETGRKCNILVTNCPYDNNNVGGGGVIGMRSPLRPTVDDHRNNGSNTNRPGSWSYMNEQDNRSQHGSNTNTGNSGSSSSNIGSSSNSNSADKDEDRDRNQQQSSSYGGRPPRPLGGSYLFDRESNDINANTKTEKAQTDVADSMNPQAQSLTGSSDESNSQGRSALGANELNKQ